MRPRQSSLGIGFHRVVELYEDPLASMRPRQSSLGIQRIRPDVESVWSRFNEAEAIKPRNPARGRVGCVRGSGHGFNEAEAIKPRNLSKNQLTNHP